MTSVFPVGLLKFLCILLTQSRKRKVGKGRKGKNESVHLHLPEPRMANALAVEHQY